MTYKDVLVEREIKVLKIVNPVKVTLNFDRSIPPIGTAILTNKKNGVYADITTDCCLVGLYPAIGFEYESLGNPNDGKITELSMCEQRNKDQKIKPIKRLKIH